MRRVLMIGLVAMLVVCGGAVAAVGWVWNRAAVSTAGKVEFANPLAIPPLAPSEIDADGRRVFDLTAAEGNHDFGAGATTRTWGFGAACQPNGELCGAACQPNGELCGAACQPNGELCGADYLGPTLRAARGEEVVVNVHNELPEQTTVHWHGMELPAAMDGGPHQMVSPDQSWSPSWRIDQPAATLWYHPHPHGRTASHVYRGLAGMFIVDDEEADALALPGEYGVDDIPVIVQDLKFTRDNQLDDRPGLLSGIGVLGDTVAVNGTVAPYLDVTTQRVRLRLLNGSTARTYALGFTDDRPFALVGTDGGLLAEPYETTRVMLSPGERAEIVVTMEPGEEAVLRSTPPPMGVGFLNRFVGGDDTLDILQLRAAADLAPSPEVPPRLVDLPRIDPAEAAQTRTFRLSGRKINDEKMDLGRVDAAVVADTVEVWEVTNADGMPHNFHMHGVQFQVRTVDGQAPPQQLRGWKDTVYVPPNGRIELVIRFDTHTDPGVPYMFHCHLLSHEDSGMMGQFLVLEPGQQPAIVGEGHDHD